MSDDEYDGAPAGLIELPKTRLSVEDGQLVRRGENGKAIIFRVPLDDIQDVVFARPMNPYSLIPFALAAGFVAIGYWVSEYNVVTVLLYVGAMLLAGFGLMGLRNDVLVLTARGKETRIACPDPTDEVRGFALSLEPLVGGR